MPYIILAMVIIFLVGLFFWIQEMIQPKEDDRELPDSDPYEIEDHPRWRR